MRVTRRNPIATAEDVASRFIDAGAFPWPQGLVGLWTFQEDRVGRSTVTSKVGSQSVVLMARGSKTVVKDDEDPGPFGPSLVLDGATVFVKDGDLGALDVSKTGDEVTVIAWVKDTAGNHDDTGSTAAAFRGGSHCDGAPPYAARQYGIYFDAHGWPWSKGRLTPHIGAQDGGSPGYTFNRDYAASARKYFTGTGQGQWHMEAMTFDGAQIIAYVDGITDILRAVPEPPATYFGGSHTSLEQVVDRNPFTLRKGINRSATAKRFTIGATVSSPTDGGLSFTTGKLGGIAVFNRALSAQEVMQIRLATLLPDEAVTMCSFEETSEGTHTLLPIGWTAYAGPLCFDVSELMASEYSINRPTGGQKSFLTKVSTAIGVALGPVTGLNSSQLRRVRFKLLSAATASAAQRVLVRVGGTWWASATTFSTSSAHASDTDWSSAESKTLNVNWDAGNWYPVTLTPSLTPTSQSYTNLAQNPALNYYATNWSVSVSAPNATGARTSTAGGYVYRLTWTGTDSPDGAGGSLAFSAITGLTAGTNYAVSVVASASKNQLLRAQIYWYAGAVQLSHTDGGVVTVAANTPTTLYVAGTAPATADGMAVKVAPTTAGVSWQSGDTMDISKVLVVAGDSIPAYFDGDTVGATWGGTPGSSTSTFTTTAIGAVYKNLVNNPDLGVNDGNWFISSSAAHATAARTASDGGYVWRLTWTGTDGTVSLGGLSYSAIEAVTAGTTYSASMQIRPSHSNKVTCDLVWYDASNNFLSATVGQVTAVGPNIWSTVRVSGVAPASAAKVSVRVATASGSYVGAQAWRSGYTCDLTHCMLVEGPYLPADYVEGSGPVAVGELSLGGATNTAWIDNALLTAVGVLSSGGDGTAVRITDIELLHTEGA